MDLALAGSAALVTGGSRGIGRSIALALAREGADVAVCGRDEERLEGVAAEIRTAGARCVPVAADLSDPDSAARVVEAAATTFGRLDILVNNASQNVDATADTLEEISDEQLSARFSGKLLLAARCTRSALPHLRKSPHGRIVFIGGLSAVTMTPERTRNGASLVSGLANAGITNFAKHLSARVAREGICVNVVHPGHTRTERAAARTEIGQLVEPDEIASVVTFLASPLAAAITGQSIAVDGGQSYGAAS
jgi:NAD(P)-dependent dehydrogenase (short-subunit alcohol dehydrogenase family)